MAAELLRLLDRCVSKRVLVLGDVMLDENLWGETRRLSAEAPVPVSGILATGQGENAPRSALAAFAVRSRRT